MDHRGSCWRRQRCRRSERQRSDKTHFDQAYCRRGQPCCSYGRERCSNGHITSFTGHTFLCCCSFPDPDNIHLYPPAQNAPEKTNTAEGRIPVNPDMRSPNPSENDKRTHCHLPVSYTHL